MVSSSPGATPLMNEVAIQLALAELQSPTFGVTEQLLAVLSFALHDGLPIVARVDDIREADACFIYVRLLDEQYFLVVVVRPSQGDLAVSAIYIEAHAQVYLAVYSQTLTSQEISERIGLLPTDI